MKREFFDVMLGVMRQNTDVFLLFVDLGWPRVDEFLSEFPSRAFTVGASEQTALDMAVGLAYQGKIPVIYTISPFYLRGFETIRTYISHENLPVIMAGAGRDEDYSKDHGFSHDASDMGDIMSLLPNIKLYFPNNASQIKGLMDAVTHDPHPCFISLKR